MKISLSELYPFGEITKEYKVFYDEPFVDDFKVIRAPEMVLTVTCHPDHRADVSGSGEITVSMPCDRCLKPVEVAVPFTVEMKFDTVNHTDADGEEIFFMEEDELDVNLLLIDEIHMNLPMKVLCREDCKGICYRCGADLNNGKCSCDSIEVPTKMAEALSKAFADAMNKK